MWDAGSLGGKPRRMPCLWTIVNTLVERWSSGKGDVAPNSDCTLVRYLRSTFCSGLMFACEHLSVLYCRVGREVGFEGLPDAWSPSSPPSICPLLHPTSSRHSMTACYLLPKRASLRRPVTGTRGTWTRDDKRREMYGETESERDSERDGGEV